MNDIIPPRRLPPPRPLSRPGSARPTLAVPPRSRPSLPRQPVMAPRQPVTLPPIAPVVPASFEKPKNGWQKWLLIGCALFALILIGSAAWSYFWYKDALKPLSASQERIKFTVDQGSGADGVASDLEQKKIIKSGLALLVYMKLHGGSNFKAGNYVFTPSQSPQEIIQWLNDGKVDTFKLTILPGKTLADLKKTFQSYGYSSDAIDTALAKPYAHPLLADKPADTTLEGYMYPDTYYVSAEAPLETVMTQSFDLFEKQINANNLRQKLADKGFTLYQAITLASIIEKEVSKPDDRRHVAQVFETRLQKDMILGSDVTYHYAAALLGVTPSPGLDSPYNTRLKKGLPPGPISNFGIEALEAVANPASTDYLYFVAGDDGLTHFSHTEEEQAANVKQYCQKLCANP